MTGGKLRHDQLEIYTKHESYDIKTAKKWLNLNF